METEESVSWVLNEVQEIFDVLEEWKESLEEIRNEDGSLEQLLMISKEVLGNPLSVVGKDFSLRAEAGQEVLPEESRIYSRDSVNMEYINALKQDDTYNQMQESKEVFLYPEYITGCRSDVYKRQPPTHCRKSAYESP